MAINQHKAYEKNEGQFEYLGRWVDKNFFRAFVYNGIEQKLAESYDEYHRLISSGLWFPTKESAKLALSDQENKKVDDVLEEIVTKAEENFSNVTKLEKKPFKPNKLR